MTLRRLESEDGESFWEAWVTDLTFSCRYGKLGSDGQTDHEKFWTRADAHAEMAARLEEMLDEASSRSKSFRQSRPKGRTHFSSSSSASSSSRWLF